MEIYNLVLVSSDMLEPVVEGFEQRLLENVDRIPLSARGITMRLDNPRN